MKRLACVCLAVLAFASLGGEFRPNPFTGNWSGTWSGEGGDGQILISVASTNQCIGEISNNGFGPAGRFSGKITNGGVINVTVVGWSQERKVPMKGTMAFDGQGGAAGTFMQTLRRNLKVDGSFSLSRN